MKKKTGIPITKPFFEVDSTPQPIVLKKTLKLQKNIAKESLNGIPITKSGD